MQSLPLIRLPDETEKRLNAPAVQPSDISKTGNMPAGVTALRVGGTHGNGSRLDHAIE
jgi:hypothetical protein